MQALLEQGDEQRACDFISGLPELNLMDKRFKLHLTAQIEMRQGRFKKAQQILQNAIENFGENIKLFSDLTACAYLQGDMILFRRLLQELEYRFQQVRHQLDPANHLRVSTILGNFLEEEGDVIKARDIYQQCLEHLIPEQHSRENYKLMAQLLRLQSAFDFKQGQAENYKKIFALKESVPTLYIHLDIQHALMLAEIPLLGTTLAHARLQSLIDKEQLKQQDQELFLFDFVDECLHRDLQIPDGILQKVEASRPSGVFEKSLKRLLEGHAFSLAEVLDLAPQMSHACYLKFLLYVLPHIPSREEESALRSQFSLLSGQLSATSAQLWNSWAELVLQKKNQTQIEIEFRSAVGIISYHAQQLDLRRKKSMCQILQQLSGLPRQRVESLVALLWGAPLSESYYHRLRLQIFRLNKFLFELTGMEKLIELQDNHVVLKKFFRIRRS